MNFLALVQDALRLGIAALIVLAAFAAGLWIWGAWNDEWSGYNAQFSVSDGYCNVAVVPLIGDIVPYGSGGYGEEEEAGAYPEAVADDTVRMIRTAEYDPYIKGILVRIDSGGGWPVASSVIADAIKSSYLPTVALIRDVGTSGAYLAATAADTIIASPVSDVGSIGVTMSYLENSLKNKEEGIQFVSLSSAPYKDAGYPDKPLTPTEHALFERDLKISHDEFVKSVAENRGLPLETVAALADGSSMTGTLALEAGLIDEVGNQETARNWFANALGLPLEEVAFCE